MARHLVGRERELDLLLAAVAAGRDVLLEGPPGTSKSTLLRSITAEWGIPLVFVEGNADLTPTRLVGHHDPARVLREDYTPDNFVPGPLIEAMRSGAFLYVEEFNRAPEDTLNTLLTAMAERRIALPRVGTVEALPSFRVIASMNPYDNVGTTRLSSSVHDRLCRLAIGYQDAEAERGIVGRRTGLVSPRLVADAVALVRATRERDDVRQGSSVRGAIDVALIAAQLAAMRGVGLPDEPSVEPPRGLPEDYTPDNFVPGPLIEAMRSGAFLYVEEFNRAPEDTLNTLLTAMAERRIAVPRVGTVEALPTFRVIASMNPYDNIGTTRLSTSVHDRLCRLSVDYQDAEAERGIVVRRTGIRSPRLVADAVGLTRATRDREDVQQGSSVRGAIDVALIAVQLATMRGVALPDDSSIDPPRGLPEAYTGLVLDAMVVALSGRIHLDETIEETPEDVLRQIWEDHFLLNPAAAQPG